MFTPRYMTFGDLATTVKPIPNISLGSEVRVASVGLIQGRINYSVALYTNKKFTCVIGPYPDSAFAFQRHSTLPELNDLIRIVTAEQMADAKLTKALNVIDSNRPRSPK